MNEVISTVLELGLSMVEDINIYIVSPKVNIGRMVVNVPLQFPYNPEKIQVRTPGNNETRNMVGIGEINLLQRPKLSSIAWESFFPGKDYLPNIKKPIGLFLPPSVYIQAFQMAMDMREPLRLVITGIGINQLVTIESFEYDHHGGTYEDKYYSIEFKEYKEFSPKLIKSSIDRALESGVISSYTTETAKDAITLDSVSKKVQEKAGSALGNPAANTIALDPKSATIGSIVKISGKVANAVSESKSTVKDQKAKVINMDNTAKTAKVTVGNSIIDVPKDKLLV